MKNKKEEDGKFKRNGEIMIKKKKWKEMKVDVIDNIEEEREDIRRKELCRLVDKNEKRIEEKCEENSKNMMIEERKDEREGVEELIEEREIVENMLESKYGRKLRKEMNKNLKVLIKGKIEEGLKILR